ncbi:hypothetical protein [Flagellimonas aequoris]|uniref:Uncharacterized protein n=3 Tax=Flagellimonas TaxID=444459 RepID=A0A418N8H6_9FLAO|nr:hypothetical protein [Allomuricauda aequoris]RIV71352.1 hypothetical protein D2U88_08160 [Allomuricauda aequoris]TXK02821.1 hypothetical protein FQ019_08090 [Allomuricauda aequoris]
MGTLEFKTMVMVKLGKIGELHKELQNWKSYLQFIDDEMVFIQRLLNSYIFEPRTPNLFERLEDFKQEFHDSKIEKNQLKKAILEHEKHLGGLVECTSDDCDSHYFEKHLEFKDAMSAYIESYLKLKHKVYSYAGSVLKRKKPQD